MLPIDLTGKRAFVAGIADDNGYGWAICKALAAAGAEIAVGTWPPVLGLFQKSLERQKLDLALRGGGAMQIAKVYPLDASFDAPEDVPPEIRDDKRYKELSGYTISEAAAAFEKDFGAQSLDILVHSLANGPEVRKPLMETSRKGYLAAVSASAYSNVSLIQRYAPLMRPGGAAVSLTYMASERVVPGYGGGMSSAKAALESDTRVLAFEAGRKYGIRVNTISAGPLPSRAAKAIGTIELLVEYYRRNSALPEVNTAADVGHTAAFLCSSLGAGITGTTVYVDKGYHSMGMEPSAVDAAKQG
ncbi:MAG: enoyl-[acyl-carrier-protein] reductase [Planctomycetes bacterium]|nr:enoyl-[acyl-carrier-protein] reductase [Planctomycetota bacterium]